MCESSLAVGSPPALFVCVLAVLCQVYTMAGVSWGLWTQCVEVTGPTSPVVIYTHYTVCWDLRTCLPLLSLYTHMECAEVLTYLPLLSLYIHTLWSVLASPVVNAHTMECCICLWPTSLACAYTRHWIFCRSPDPLVSLLSRIYSHMICISCIYVHKGKGVCWKFLGWNKCSLLTGPPWGSSEY